MSEVTVPDAGGFRRIKDSTDRLVELLSTGVASVGREEHAEVRFFAGDWQEARRFLDAAMASDNLRVGPLSMLSVLETEMGDIAQGTAYIDQLWEFSSRRSTELPGFT